MVNVPALQSPDLSVPFNLAQSYGAGLRDRNAFADQSQRQQMNAFALQDAQQKQQDRNALSAAGPQITSNDPAQREQGYRRLSDQPELVMRLRKEASDQDKEAFAQAKERIAASADAAGRAAVGLGSLSDDQLAEHWPAAVAALEAKVGHPAPQWRQAQNPKQMRQVLEGSIADAQTVQQALGEADKAADRKLREKDLAQRALQSSPDYQARVEGAKEGAKLKAQTGALGAGGDEITQSYVDDVMSGATNLNNVPMARRDLVAKGLADLLRADPARLPPGAQQRIQAAASRVVAPYIDSSQYKLAANGLPYIERINAALKNPGSVGDQEAIDSLTKLANSGSAVTEAQVKLITGYGSLSDWASVLANKFRNGGALSQSQRDQIKKVANETFDAYEKGVTPIYEEATGKLKARGINQAYWPIMDVKGMSQKIRASLGDTQGAGKAPAVGAIEDGHRFKGGDPSKQENWERVQ